MIQPVPGQIVPPWSKPIDATAPEALSTPDPTSFPDDILTYLTTTHDEARRIYNDDLRTHVTPGILEACPAIMDPLMSDLALSVFVPQTWQGIKMEPVHLDVKPDLPAFLKPRARPIRRVFKDFEDWTIVILDNFLILVSSYQDATDKLSLVLTRCHEYRLVLKMKKSWIGTDVVKFFGYELKPGS